VVAALPVHAAAVPSAAGLPYASICRACTMIRRLLNIAKEARKEFLSGQQLIHGRLQRIQRHLNQLTIMERERYVKDVLSDPRYDDGKRLERYGFKIYSQYDEDGIIQEIFNRIGATSRTFIEFGVGNGLENNTLALLLNGWNGLWIEGSAPDISRIQSKFRDTIANGRLRLKAAFVDRDNIYGLIGEYFGGEIDFLSVDIDGNDIHVLAALDVVRPRVITIEYNAKFPPPISIAQRYEAGFVWNRTDYMGASLAAIAKVASAKGYSLVGCGIAGVNAFFVRNDLLADKFAAPFTAENHYQPARYFLEGTFVAGHPPDWGPYEAV
jgi:hypothetical protein